MAESEDSRLAELLLHGLQPIENGKAELVHLTETRKVVCEEATTLRLDQLDPGGQILVYTVWTQIAIVICMRMNDEHRKAV